MSVEVSGVPEGSVELPEKVDQFAHPQVPGVVAAVDAQG